ncbi:unnamed protein product [Vitrella brassicaformis CCMP3155]|uniref:Uncharacterized protein n=1 Tax=Vitrella brassicaformis (strain CCMP3155) TaxID=1169540 RepID=A0A0G4EHW1_VITBC|nr:unnamed protein product [Vitrella brassicaformis CCMP3155]|eukprot:CEL95504.1 unnamed protein product [Vitrella brassicaformis CCMP3155]
MHRWNMATETVTLQSPFAVPAHFRIFSRHKRWLPAIVFEATPNDAVDGDEESGQEAGMGTRRTRHVGGAPLHNGRSHTDRCTPPCCTASTFGMGTDVEGNYHISSQATSLWAEPGGSIEALMIAAFNKLLPHCPGWRQQQEETRLDKMADEDQEGLQGRGEGELVAAVPFISKDDLEALT